MLHYGIDIGTTNREVAPVDAADSLTQAEPRPTEPVNRFE